MPNPFFDPVSNPHTSQSGPAGLSAALLRKVREIDPHGRRPESVVACMCHGVSFGTLKETVESESLVSLAQLRDAEHCGNGCGMCRPYVRLMLGTGRTEFPVYTAGEMESLQAIIASGESPNG